MGNTWVSNVLHYLDADGEFAARSGPARRIAEHVCAIVEAVTSRKVGHDGRATAVRCRRRPGHVRCSTPILANYAENDPASIEWCCPACGDNGFVRGWQETKWDKRT